ncbi:MAG: sterol desaturase family protein [Halobacteriovoraceae bacterium]|nr:sterol desaturase family protein [Halobacteriovoraceae bacterium]
MNNLKHNRAKLRLFNSNFWESLSRTNSWAPALFWLFVIGGLFYTNSDKGITVKEHVALFFIGLIVWTLVEYIFHRFIFHFPIFGPKSERFNFVSHGIHHEDAHDLGRAIMPITPAAIYTVLLYGVFFQVFGEKYGPTFLAYFLMGFISYDYYHFSNHVMLPKSKLGKYLRKNHLIHHVYPHVNFGVTSPIWDFAFGTYANKKTIHQRPKYPLCATSEGIYKDPVARPKGVQQLTQEEIENDFIEIYKEVYPGSAIPEEILRTKNVDSSKGKVESDQRVGPIDGHKRIL